MIAEDELLVRIGIASCVPWNELDLMLAAEAEDGDEAWALYQTYTPDIAIIDIRMPGMSGIDLIRKIRSMNRRCEIIIITNVEQDETLSEARKLGVDEILLKVTMKKTDINAAVRRVCRLLKDNADEGNVQPTDADLHEYLFDENTNGIPLFEVKGMIGLRVFPDDRMSHQMQMSLANLVVHRLNCPSAFVSVSHGSCLLLLWKDSPEKYTSIEMLLELARYVQDNFRVKIGIAVIFDAIENELQHMTHVLVELLHSPEMFDRAVLQLNSSGFYQGERLDGLKRKLVRSLPLCIGQQVFSEIKWKLDQYPGAVERGFEKISDQSKSLLSLLELGEGYDGFYEMTESICGKIEQMLEREFLCIRPEMQKALDYINHHLSDDLSLERVSKYVNFQSSYFSRVFKNEVHCSYSEYLFYARMIHAQELLANTEIPISEVAHQCGFLDLSYFSTRFRQFCGISPRQWREK